MPSTVVTVAILTVAGIIMASTLAVALLSNVGTIDSMFRVLLQNTLNKAKTSIDVVHLTLNTSNNKYYFIIFLKNTGQRSISSTELENTDVYFGDENSVMLYPYGITGLGVWNYSEIKNDGSWSPGETLIIRIYNTTSLPGSTYYVKVVLPNGVSDEAVFGKT